MDESLFSSKSWKRAQWAQIGKALRWDKRNWSDKFIAVCGATSVERGFVLWHAREAEAFNTETFVAFLRDLKDQCKQRHIAILLDNAGYHSGEEVDEVCDRWDIHLIYNVVARPDLNGIEEVWGWAKVQYRKQVDWFKANNVAWEAVPLVNQVLSAIPEDIVVKYTKKGFERIQAVIVIREDKWEDRPGRKGVLVDPLKILKPVQEADERQWGKLQANLHALPPSQEVGVAEVPEEEDGDEGEA